MGGTDHLWKINNDRLAGFSSNEDVEFVVVAVDETCASEADDDVH